MNAPPPPSARLRRFASGRPHGGHHGMSLALAIFVISVLLVLFSKQENAGATATAPGQVDPVVRIKELEQENASLKAKVEKLEKERK